MYIGALLLLLAAPTDVRGTVDEPALSGIRPEALRAHMRFLADDLLDGRGTATRGARDRGALRRLGVRSPRAASGRDRRLVLSASPPFAARSFWRTARPSPSTCPRGGASSFPARTTSPPPA